MNKAVSAASRDARATYVSFTAAVVIPMWFSFCAGFYCGCLAGAFAWLLGWGNPLKVMALGFATAGLLAWLTALRWWIRQVARVEADAWDLQYAMVSQRAVMAPLVIEHRKPTDGGLVTERVKCPASAAQLQLAARILLPMKGRFNLRSLYEVLGQEGAVQFRDWLVREGYAYGVGDTGQVEISSKGVEMLRKAASFDPYPTGGQLIRLERDR